MTASAGAAAVPSAASQPRDEFGLTQDERGQLFDQLVSEIERLDAEALEVRRNTHRPLSWQDTIASLRTEFIRARTKWEYKQVFERLNFTYPNEHAQVKYGPGFPEEILENPRQPAVVFQTFWPARTRTINQVIFVDPRVAAVGADRPEIGDEIVAINGRSIGDWIEENFNYCKHALRIQCDAVFFRQFQWERLSWNTSMPLRYTLKRGPHTFEFEVPLLAPQESPADPPRSDGVVSEVARYPGFTTIYSGEQAFLYQSESRPRTAILRIRSFGYRAGSRFRRPADEVQAMAASWTGDFDHVLIDLTENRGGDDPLPYLALLTPEPRLRQFTRIQFRKGKELTEPSLRQSLFWNDPDRLAYYERLEAAPSWPQRADGQFLPPEPDFCGETCNGVPTNIDHGFRGRISVLVASSCLSSCDEFVLTLEKYLGARMTLIGHPTFSDTGFSRLKIEVARAPVAGRWVSVVPYDTEPTEATLVQQGVVVTRSVDAQGELSDGKPLDIDVHVPLTLANRRTWYQDAVRLALER